jgi:hypothetical protein
MFCVVLSCFVVSVLVLCCVVLCCVVLEYVVWSCLDFSCLVVLVLSGLVLSCHMLSSFVFYRYCLVTVLSCLVLPHLDPKRLCPYQDKTFKTRHSRQDKEKTQTENLSLMVLSCLPLSRPQEPMPPTRQDNKRQGKEKTQTENLSLMAGTPSYTLMWVGLKDA